MNLESTISNASLNFEKIIKRSRNVADKMSKGNKFFNEKK